MASSNQAPSGAIFCGETSDVGYVLGRMRYFWIFALLVLAVCALNGCASTSSSTAASGDPVPGESKSEESRLQPTTSGGTPGATVKW